MNRVHWAIGIGLCLSSTHRAAAGGTSVYDFTINSNLSGLDASIGVGASTAGTLIGNFDGGFSGSDGGFELWRYDGTSVKNFTAADGLTTKDVMGIYTDRNGDLWLAGNGVFRFDGTRFERRF